MSCLTDHDRRVGGIKTEVVRSDVDQVRLVEADRVESRKAQIASAVSLIDRMGRQARSNPKP